MKNQTLLKLKKKHLFITKKKKKDNFISKLLDQSGKNWGKLSDKIILHVIKQVNEFNDY